MNQKHEINLRLTGLTLKEEEQLINNYGILKSENGSDSIFGGDNAQKSRKSQNKKFQNKSTSESRKDFEGTGTIRDLSKSYKFPLQFKNQ